MIKLFCPVGAIKNPFNVRGDETPAKKKISTGTVPFFYRSFTLPLAASQ
jgi:hypothetical protein